MSDYPFVVPCIIGLETDGRKKARQNSTSVGFI